MGREQLTARICWTTLQSMFAFKCLLSSSHCQNTLERHGLNIMPEIAVLLHDLFQAE